jgi:hypothetical protein
VLFLSSPPVREHSHSHYLLEEGSLERGEAVLGVMEKAVVGELEEAGVGDLEDHRLGHASLVLVLVRPLSLFLTSPRKA